MSLTQRRLKHLALGNHFKNLDFCSELLPNMFYLIFYLTKAAECHDIKLFDSAESDSPACQYVRVIKIISKNALA